jgi:hypothetical protein
VLRVQQRRMRAALEAQAPGRGPFQLHQSILLG